jgi:hypothetical protein
MNIGTGCLCVCAPVGHHHGVCQSTSEPGLFVALNRTQGGPVRLPACRPCHDAVRRQAWANASMAATAGSTRVVPMHSGNIGAFRASA